ncbi:MAG TPA: hypothetical protein VGF48_20125 [Thermoanaerobaculia bacterium]|jgi:hypothetical protein
MHAIRATPRHARAIEATADLLNRLKIDAMFVGSVARSAYLGSEVEHGAIDVLTLMNGPQKNQVAMMGSNRGFRVEREELAATEELDLVPMNFVDPDGDVRVHVLLATNALYGRMFGNAVETNLGERALKVPGAEDVALLLAVTGDEDSVRMLTMLPDFNRHRYNQRLVSIGLGRMVVAE